MRIAICDDEAVFASQYDEYIEKLSNTFQKIDYDIFFSGEDLLKRYDSGEKPYDMIFLDIQMKGMNGIDTARKIREFDESVILVYVTNYTQYVFESFDVSPFRFIVKPINYDKFAEIIIAAYSKMQRSKKSIYFTENRKTIRLYCDEIYYIESDKRLLRIHTMSETHQIYGTMDRMEQQLSGHDFILVHKSYLVNMNYIAEFGKNSVKITNGDVIPVSEARSKEMREAHMKFLLRCYKK